MTQENENMTQGNGTETETKKKNEIPKHEARRKELAERVAASLEAGVIPWQRYGLPVAPPTNAATGREYKGINALYLLEKCAEKGYRDNKWITLSDANKHGFMVKQGENGVALEHWGENKDGKLSVRSYSVFNVEQLNACIPLPEAERRPDFSRANAMLKRAGIEMNDEAKWPDYLEQVKALASEAVKKQSENVHTEDLKALRYSMVVSRICRETRLDTGMPLDAQAQTNSWSVSIRRNPRELFNATRDADKIADGLLKGMEYERSPEPDRNAVNWNDYEAKMQKVRAMQEARQEKSEAQRAEGIVADAVLLPDGLDSNLPNADLNAEQEAVKSSAEKAVGEIAQMRASASAKEEQALSNPTAAATKLAKEKMKRGAIVTDAQAGKTYTGKIIGLAGTHPDAIAVQRITGNQAVLHKIKEIATESNLAVTVGAGLTITKGMDGKSTVKTREETVKEKNKENDIEERAR
ncbi:MAG: ssDNA-binding domain-containing protein [Synergistaceae bacterium]|nr:ssDNA-binding domain-containing protein [Synergistaceae bacterium]